MPIISAFFGLRITMYYDDHMPPHFHVNYGSDKALVNIEEERIERGALPAKQLKLILAWTVIHHAELMENWELAKNHMPLKTIDPLM